MQLATGNLLLHKNRTSFLIGQKYQSSAETNHRMKYIGWKEEKKQNVRSMTDKSADIICSISLPFTFGNTKVYSCVLFIRYQLTDSN
jgi:hypothetical protein